LPAILKHSQQIEDVHGTPLRIEPKKLMQVLFARLRSHIVEKGLQCEGYEAESIEIKAVVSLPTGYNRQGQLVIAHAARYLPI